MISPALSGSAVLVAIGADHDVAENNRQTADSLRREYIKTTSPNKLVQID